MKYFDVIDRTLFKGFFTTFISLSLLCVVITFLFLKAVTFFQDYNFLKIIQSKVVTVSTQSLDPENEGKYICIQGKAITHETIRDRAFGVSVTEALGLQRIVSMYQSKKYGRSQSRRVWSEKLLEHSSNPSTMPFKGYEYIAKTYVGALQISDGFVKEMQRVPYILKEENYNRTDPLFKKRFTFYNNKYISGHPESPKIGDIAIYYTITMPAEISLIGKQELGIIKVCEINNHSITLLEMGTKSIKEIFDSKRQKLIIDLWDIHIILYGLLCVGFFLLGEKHFLPFSFIKTFPTHNVFFNSLLISLGANLALILLAYLYVSVTNFSPLFVF